METIQVWISHYGYFGIFSLLFLGIIGLPVPDETLLTLVGFLIYRGDLHLFPAFLSAYLGSITGISVSYAIGSTFGHHVLVKYGHYVHITEKRLQTAHNWFEKIGRWALTVGYFIPGVRHVVAILAGTSELQMWEFALFAYMGGLIWTSVFLSIGYFFGDKWKIMLAAFHHHLVIISITVLVLLIVGFFLKKKFGKSKNVKDNQKQDSN